MKGSGFFTQGTSATPNSEADELEGGGGRSQAANTAPNPPTAKIFMRSRRDIPSRRARLMSAATWLRVRGITVPLAEGEGHGDRPSNSASRREAGSEMGENMDDKMGRRCSILQGWRGHGTCRVCKIRGLTRPHIRRIYAGQETLLQDRKHSVGFDARRISIQR